MYLIVAVSVLRTHTSDLRTYPPTHTYIHIYLDSRLFIICRILKNQKSLFAWGDGGEKSSLIIPPRLGLAAHNPMYKREHARIYRHKRIL